MATALALARRGLGNVWPNPAVGCVVVKDGQVVGRGWTQPGGRPHAETEALARAGEAAAGATAYVTLEPCSHVGRTPPCTDALLAARIRRCVVATVDPDPRVNGNGLRRLREAGVEVVTGCLAAEAEALNAGFFMRVRQGRPLVALKIAASADGRIATASGHSRWITGPAAREEGHRLRATHDAIMVGSGTVLADDPDLTCRLPGLEPLSPVRVVMDRRLRLPTNARLARTAREVPLWVFSRGGAPLRASALESGGTRIFRVAAMHDPDALREVLAALAGQGITRLLVEGGATLATSLLRERLVDRIHLFTAPVLLGGDGRAAIEALGIGRVDEASRWHQLEVRSLGEDHLAVYERQGLED
ncbi:MAG: bifunctional diaminohydroxyphosphoribosylaminopyrimidine deaminase/5-amino-6-(5-phosphoribosylamino)uracil reductase RibD [Geminicoccaceae bacterium]